MLWRLMIQCVFLSWRLNLYAVFGVPHVGFGTGQQDWGFAEVRPGAYMFWWLYYTTYLGDGHYTDRPLIIWLQGGPGGSSTGYGNFEEIGPLDSNLHERQNTWVKRTVTNNNVLFIDNPVGSGFSYVDEQALLVKDNEEIARDLVMLVREFYHTHPEFYRTPLHIFSESYGGKMAVEFAYQLDGAIKRGVVNCNLQSVSLGAPWISPEDSIVSWAEFLLNLGFVDTKGYYVIQNAAENIRNLIRGNATKRATDIWRNLEHIVLNETIGIDCYNVLMPQKFRRHIAKDDDEILEFSENIPNRVSTSSSSIHQLSRLMRGPVSASLNIPDHVHWGSQKDMVFEALSNDFMRPASATVELLLNNTNLNVSIYTGQLDLVVCTPGTVRWVENLYWPGRDGYLAAPRIGMGSLGILEGYEKSFDRLSMFWINRAGHMAPVDNPMAMEYILEKTVGT